MASYQKYRKKDGTVSVTATIRRVGVKPLSATYTGDTEREARSEAEFWARGIERQIRQKKYKDPSSGKIRLEDAFKRYFKEQDLQLQFTREARQKKPNTIKREKHAREAIFKSETLAFKQELKSISIVPIALCQSSLFHNLSL